MISQEDSIHSIGPERYDLHPVKDTAGNILVVDDNPQNLRLLVAMLEKYGYKVRPVTRGVDAIQSALSQIPDLVLLDIMMPDMDGYEVCKDLKKSDAVRSVPIIFISAVDAVSDKVKAFEMGAVDYITKPFQVEEILARVNTHISLRKIQKQLENEIERRKASELALQTVSMKYQQMASQDYLTGINNRRYFIERAEEEMVRARRYQYPVSMIMMDIDHFKMINDTYGHHAGDIILKRVAMNCIDNLRLNDLLGRIGGEEFAVLLPQTDLKEGKYVADRLRKSIESSVWNIENSLSISCTVSIGVSHLADNNSKTVDMLMKEADDALYIAKSSGRNCVR